MTSVIIREFDGGRPAEFDCNEDTVFLDVGGHSYAYDKGTFLHGLKRSLGVTIMSSEGVYS